VVEAILLTGGRVVAAGSAAEVEAHPAATGAERIDLSGETVLPGLTDAHAHVRCTARNVRAVDLGDCRSLGEALRRVEEAGRNVEPGGWIHGVGFCDALWEENRLPTRPELDALRVSAPILLTRVCTHIQVVNGEALRRSGLPDDPEADGILREGDGAPAVRAFERWFAESGAEERALEEQLLRWCSSGVTEVQTCGAEEFGMSEDLLPYQKLRADRRLPLRILLYADREPPLGMGSGFGDDRIRYGGFKFFLDGSLGGRTAALSRPYSDDPGNAGQYNRTDPVLFEQAERLHRGGVQLLIHAIGDGALDQAIRLLRHLREAGPHPLGFRHRINHVMLCREDQLEALVELDPVLDVQPAFVPSDLAMLEARVGADRIPWSYRWGDFVRRGLVVTGSSDSPVEPVSPFRGIWAAMARTDASGFPEGGLTPSERLTLEEALRLFTVGPAAAAGERWRGRLLPGCLADLAVCDRDILSADPEEIRETRASALFVGGRRVL
jgi:predicted amidohydrolase YtcJ